jgi:hypothetical protein
MAETCGSVPDLRSLLIGAGAWCFGMAVGTRGLSIKRNIRCTTYAHRALRCADLLVVERRSMRLARLASTVPAINWLQTVGSWNGGTHPGYSPSRLFAIC